MQANNFDEALRRQYEAYDPPYDPASWKALAQKLPASRRAGRILLWPVALGVAASAAATCVMLFSPLSRDHRSDSGNSQSIATNGTAKRASMPPVDTVEKQASASVSVTSGSRRLAFVPATEVHPAESETVTPTSPMPAGTTDAGSPEQTIVRKDVVPASDHNTGYFVPISAYDPAKEKKEAKTVISLAGGVQYGSLNTGYVAGVEVRHEVSTRWYLETGIGYMNYTSSGVQQVTATEYDNIGRTFINGSPQGSAKVESHRIVQYLQAAPGIGFRVMKRVSVGAGLDLQRALQNSDQDAIQVEGDDVKLLPLFDVGATGKVVFRLGGRLEAGILYRQGMNNLLRPGQNYLDRQYIQVQLKLPLLRR